MHVIHTWSGMIWCWPHTQGQGCTHRWRASAMPTTHVGPWPVWYQPLMKGHGQCDASHTWRARANVIPATHAGPGSAECKPHMEGQGQCDAGYTCRAQAGDRQPASLTYTCLSLKEHHHKASAINQRACNASSRPPPQDEIALCHHWVAIFTLWDIGPIYYPHYIKGQGEETPTKSIQPGRWPGIEFPHSSLPSEGGWMTLRGHWRLGGISQGHLSQL